MNLTEAELGPVTFWGPNEDGTQALVISDDPHDCGWPERITYVDRETLHIVRSGCAGCDSERPVPAKHLNMLTKENQ
jgi:hypothetical protein